MQKYRKYNPPSTLNSNQIPKKTAITQTTLRASVQHTGCLTVAGMYRNCTKEESPEIDI